MFFFCLFFFRLLSGCFVTIFHKKWMLNNEKRWITGWKTLKCQSYFLFLPKSALLYKSTSPVSVIKLLLYNSAAMLIIKTLIIGVENNSFLLKPIHYPLCFVFFRILCFCDVSWVIIVSGKHPLDQKKKTEDVFVSFLCTGTMTGIT